MASSERGTKRTDPDTGKKFYDLNMDPIVSPYTGKSYPRSYFEQVLAGKPHAHVLQRRRRSHLVLVGGDGLGRTGESVLFALRRHGPSVYPISR